MKLYWTPASPFVRKVMVTAHELGLSDRIEIVKTIWPHQWATHTIAFDPPDFVVANPIGRIPTLLTDSGIALPESNLICRHLNAKAGGGLIPRDADPDLPLLRLWALGDGALEAMIARRAETLRTLPERSDDFIGKQKDRIFRCFDTFDLSLLESSSNLTIAHITVAVACGYMDFRYPSDNWRENRARLAAWYQAFSSRPSLEKTAHGETPQQR